MWPEELNWTKYIWMGYDRGSLDTRVIAELSTMYEEAAKVVAPPVEVYVYNFQNYTVEKPPKVGWSLQDYLMNKANLKHQTLAAVKNKLENLHMLPDMVVCSRPSF